MSIEAGVCERCGLEKGDSGKTDAPKCSCESAKSEQFSTSPICTTCGKQIFSRESASLTQWIFSYQGCRCAETEGAPVSPESKLEPPVVAPVRAKTTAKLCAVCGKRENIGGPGSLTQWIFSSHLCRCGKAVKPAAHQFPSEPIITHSGGQNRRRRAIQTSEEEPDVWKVVLSAATASSSQGEPRKQAAIILVSVFVTSALLLLTYVNLFQRPSAPMKNGLPVATKTPSSPINASMVHQNDLFSGKEEEEKPSPNWNVDQLLARGTKLFHESNHVASLRYFDAALKKGNDIQRVQALSGRGEVYADLSKLDEALKNFNEAVQLGEKLDKTQCIAFARVLRYRALLFMRLNQPQQALLDLNREIALEKSIGILNDGSYAERSKAFDALKDYDKAIADMTIAIGRRSDSASLYYDRAKLFEKSGKLEQAKQDRIHADRLSMMAM